MSTGLMLAAVCGRCSLSLACNPSERIGTLSPYRLAVSAMLAPGPPALVRMQSLPPGAFGCVERAQHQSSSSSMLVARWIPHWRSIPSYIASVSYTHLRAHETRHDLVCRLLLE